MVGKKTSKRSTLYNKGTNATLDKYFTIKNKNTENDTIQTTENENDTKSSTSLSSDISKQQQQQQTKKPLSTNKESESPTINQKRRPLADIGGKSTLSMTMLPTAKPAKPSFTVLRDDDIEQGVTEANGQEQQQQQECTQTSIEQSNLHISGISTPKQQPQTISTCDTTQQQNDDDTHDSQSSVDERHLGSPESFFSDGQDSTTEFRVDTLDSDDSDDDDINDATTSSFFDDDDDDEPLFLTKTHRRTHFPTPASISIPSKRSFENKDQNESHNNKLIKSSYLDFTNTSPSSTTTDETDNRTTTSGSSSKFSIPSSLHTRDDHQSSSEKEIDDTDSPSPPSPSSVVAKDSTITTQQQQDAESPTPQLQCSQSSRTSELPTLPMSLPLDESLDEHVPYPVPRGKQVIDKFGH